MKFEWDEAKRRRILEERRLDFEAADLFFDGRPVIHQSTPRNDEDRWKSTARMDGHFFTVVWSWRDGVIRVISMRRAHAQEIRKYRETHGG
jgi:hypothetical protein